MRNAYLDNIHYTLGESRYDVSQAVSSGLTVSTEQALRDAGFSKHYICEASTPVYQLAKRCLEPLSDELNDVDAIVYSTCLPVNSNIGMVESFHKTGDVKHLMEFPASHLQHDFNMHEAQVFGLTQMACTGVLASLRMARMLINDDQDIHKVLCITADRFPEHAHYEQSYNLISDGAAACLVTDQPDGYRIIGAHGLTNGALAAANDDETVGSFFTNAHQVINETLNKANLTLADIDWIVPQNTHRNAWQILSSLLPFDYKRIAHPTISEVGHVISGDNLINLKHLEQKDCIKNGDKVLLFMAGYGLNWHCVLLEKEGGK
jgi:3-oxoacyl-[acyl-carrier-protein] synthase-3